MTATRDGTSCRLVASREVHGSASRNPGVFGTVAVVPVASTTAWRARSLRVPSTVTARSPSMTPWPLITVMPAEVAQSTWDESSWLWVNESRRFRTASTSSGPAGIPGKASAASRTCPGRSSALLGIQAQYEHSPPTSSCSTIAAVRLLPAMAYAAAFSPAGPPPITMTSNSSVIAPRYAGSVRVRSFTAGYESSMMATVAPMTRQKILITGASSGLGEEMARRFAAAGRDLALCARRDGSSRRAAWGVGGAVPVDQRRSARTRCDRTRFRRPGFR